MPKFNFFMNKVQKSFPIKGGTLQVLKDISFEVAEHEFVCLMGSTGCGKSTLMRIISGLERCTGGDFYFYDDNASERMASRVLCNNGVIFQSDNLMEWRTVYQNVKLPLEVFRSKSGRAADADIMEMLTLVGLQDYKDCYPRELSGGMRQRCAIARALVHNPSLLLLDQPFGALDAITRKMLNQELLNICHERGTTAIMVTNSVGEALTLGSRVLVLSPAPATISGSLAVPLTYEERTGDVMLNPKFLELRRQLNALVRGQTPDGHALEAVS